jgi:hypothetical protein
LLLDLKEHSLPPFWRLSRAVANRQLPQRNRHYVSESADVCHDGVVAYEFDEQAQQGAANFPVSEDEADRLRAQCARNAAELGEDGVHGHTVSLGVAWDEPPGLPDGVPRTRRISRRDILDIGEQVPAGMLPAASFVWGWGGTGYGPRRFRDICAAAGGQLQSSLKRVLAEINKNLDSSVPPGGGRLGDSD